MNRRPRRNHTPAFKAKVALSAIKGDRKRGSSGAADIFGRGGGNGSGPPAIDVKSLHAKIGELTLENDFFLAGALGKAGSLSARR
jgi:hypothetical protein